MKINSINFPSIFDEYHLSINSKEDFNWKEPLEEQENLIDINNVLIEGKLIEIGFQTKPQYYKLTQSKIMRFSVFKYRFELLNNRQRKIQSQMEY